MYKINRIDGTVLIGLGLDDSMTNPKGCIGHVAYIARWIAVVRPVAGEAARIEWKMRRYLGQ